MTGAAATPGDPFALPIAPNSRLIRAAIAAARPALDRALRLPDLRQCYARAQSGPFETFEARLLHALDVRFRLQSTGGGIPPRGPLIIAANHPTGAMDGLILVEAVRQVRSDVRLLANHLLHTIPELHASCFFVDPFGGSKAAARSRAGLRAAHLWLRQGGALIMFPAGEVAWRGDGMDSTWHPTVGRLALATGADILPAFIDARNSRVFSAAGFLHPLLRTCLLGRELLNKRGTTTTIYLGGAALGNREGTSTDPRMVTDTVRRAVDLTASGVRSASSGEATAVVEPPGDPSLLAQDVERLPPEALLLSSGVYDVFCASSGSIPNVLREIGRLREMTFRAVGEGTGRSTDLDRFDLHYQHLFVWNRARLQVVGAYRIGPIDTIVAARGIDGLYTRTLFRYDDRIVQRLSPALELGRSFVRAEYQRSYNALLLLWKGIGRFVARSPHYRVLFGPVSISSRYQETSQAMLRAFLSVQHGDPGLAALVEPLNPPPAIAPPARETVAIGDVDDIDATIRRLEGDLGMPVLLRQYLRLHATVLGFNVDPGFGDTLDALMMVDLARLPLATLQRYMGAADAAAFLERYRPIGASATAA